MNHAAAVYRRHVRRAMQCSRANKERRLHDRDILLSSFVEENPDSGIDDIVQKFGTPYEMAASLCEGISKDERRRWKWRQRSIIGVCILLCIGLIIGLSYSIAMRFAKAPVHVTQEVYIYDNPA